MDLTTTEGIKSRKFLQTILATGLVSAAFFMGRLDAWQWIGAMAIFGTEYNVANILDKFFQVKGEPK